MQAAPQLLVRRSLRRVAKISAERRRHRRMPLRVAGRFMRADKQEYVCQTANISVGGIAVLSPTLVEIGEPIVAYFEHLGGIEGTVARVYDGGFAIKIRASSHKREKLSAQITWLVNRHELPGHIERKHDRFGGGGRQTTLRLDEGIVIDCEILDLSVSGASLQTNARPPIDSVVIVGKLKARVRRHHEKGIGLQFFEVQTSDALQRLFG